MAIDEQLLQRSKQVSTSDENEAAGKLIEAKNSTRIEAEMELESEEEDVDFSQYSPFARLGNIALTQKIEKDKQGKESDPASRSKSFSKIKQAINGILKLSWSNLIFFSFGTSIFVIDLIVFMGMLMPDMFPKLGQEWVPEEIKKISPKKAEEFGKQIGMAEKGCCCAANGCCGLVWLIIIVIVGIVAYAYTNAADAVLRFGQTIVSAITGGGN